MRITTIMIAIVLMAMLSSCEKQESCQDIDVWRNAEIENITNEYHCHTLTVWEERVQCQHDIEYAMAQMELEYESKRKESGCE